MTARPTTGRKVPDFTLPSDGGGQIRLSELRGRKVVLYFYPKDDTTGCTREACAFREAAAAFRETNAEILGVSRDSVARHDRFKAKHDLPFTLLSDEDAKTCGIWGTWVEKSMYGRKYMGIDRSTFLIDETGTLRREWRKVRIPGHVEQVLEAAREL